MPPQCPGRATITRPAGRGTTIGVARYGLRQPSVDVDESGERVLTIRGPFVPLWVTFAVTIIGFDLWSAFGRKGATSVLERRD